LVISCGDGAVDLEVAEHPLDAVALTVKPLAVADRLGAVGFWRGDGANAALFEVIADRIGIISLVGDEGAWRPLRQIDQRVVAFAVRRFAGREVEGDGAASGITETMNFTGEPAPRAAKSSLMIPLFRPLPRCELTYIELLLLATCTASVTAGAAGRRRLPQCRSGSRAASLPVEKNSKGRGGRGHKVAGVLA
jgi:hypothetical protein